MVSRNTEMKLSEIIKTLEDKGYQLSFHMTIEAYVPWHIRKRRRKKDASKRKKE